MSSEEQFIHLLNQHQKIIHKVSHMYAQAEATREDLFQEIVLQAWKAFDSFKGHSKFSTWLYRVALNTSITFYRKTKRTPEMILADSLPEKMEEADHTPEDQVQALHRAIGALSNIDKALVMLYLEDYSYQEIGDILGISANNVGVKMNRVKLKLKEGIHKYYQF